MSIRSPPNGGPGGPRLEAIDQTTHFSCTICSRVFTKRLSRNRHVLYCRQKQLKQNHSRKKSCILCRHAKTRCSETIPQCMRCKTKGLECKYDGELQRDSTLNLVEGVRPAASGAAEPATLTAQAQQMHLLNSGYEEHPQVNFRPRNLTPSHGLLPDPLDSEISFDWDLQAPQFAGQDDFFALHSLGQMVQNMSSSANQLAVASYPEGSSKEAGDLEYEPRPPLSVHEYPVTQMACADSSLRSCQGLLQYSSYLNTAGADVSLLSAQAAQIELNSAAAKKHGLFRRRQRSFGSQLSCYYLLQTLRSYPRMISLGALPPFIHPNCGSFGSRNLVASSMEATDSPLQEPLANCKSILYLYFSKAVASTSFVWRTIDMELTRIGTEFRAFDEWTLMSTLQALTIYILLATLEDDNFSPSIDGRMLHVMMAVAAKIEEPSYMYGIAQYGEWQAWILQESRDRTFTLLFIINKLFDINPTHDANVCNAILVMPVPAYKSLWQATNFPEWEKAHNEFIQKREGRPSLTYRDMVKLHQKSQTSKKNTLDDLDEWFLNLDAFGTFVLMTASSIREYSDEE